MRTLLVFTVGWLACATAVADGQDRPSIVYIMLDEWGYYEWSAMGHPILDTPNIDQFSSEGMRFTQFLAGANVCGPTRSTLMTGQHLGHTPVRDNKGWTPLPAGEPTVASMLKDAGYATGGFGKWGLGAAGTTGVPEEHGFDVFFGYYDQRHAHTYFPSYLLRNSKRIALKGNTDHYHEGETFSHTLIFEESMKFIRDNGAAGKPFFAYLPWTPPHGQWGIPEGDPAWLKYKDKPWDAPNQRGGHDPHVYAAMVEMVDRQLGEMMALLKELGIDENTIVFLCGDNGGAEYFANDSYPHGFFAPNLNPVTGERFRGGKGDFYEGGLRVPFLVRWPEKIKPGVVSGHLGYFPDVMPTLAELTGATARSNSDGISIVPTLLGENAVGRKQDQHEFLYWERGNYIAVRMGDWKAVRPPRSERMELYNLKTDPQELSDIADRHPDILKRMQAHAERASTPARAGQILDPDAPFDPSLLHD